MTCLPFFLQCHQGDETFTETGHDQDGLSGTLDRYLSEILKIFYCLLGFLNIFFQGLYVTSDEHAMAWQDVRDHSNITGT